LANERREGNKSIKRYITNNYNTDMNLLKNVKLRLPANTARIEPVYLQL
jgi:hypothetical protein